MSDSSTNNQWHCLLPNGLMSPPLDEVDLKRKFSANIIDSNAFVRREGFDDWVPLSTIAQNWDSVDELESLENILPTPPYSKQQSQDTELSDSTDLLDSSLHGVFQDHALTLAPRDSFTLSSSKNLLKSLTTDNITDSNSIIDDLPIRQKSFHNCRKKSNHVCEANCIPALLEQKELNEQTSLLVPQLSFSNLALPYLLKSIDREENEVTGTAHIESEQDQESSDSSFLSLQLYDRENEVDSVPVSLFLEASHEESQVLAPRAISSNPASSYLLEFFDDDETVVSSIINNELYIDSESSDGSCVSIGSTDSQCDIDTLPASLVSNACHEQAFTLIPKESSTVLTPAVSSIPQTIEALQSTLQPSSPSLVDIADLERKYYCNLVNNVRLGPMSIAEMREAFVAGTITETSSLWCHGFSSWILLADATEILHKIKPSAQLLEEEKSWPPEKAAQSSYFSDEPSLSLSFCSQQEPALIEPQERPKLRTSLLSHSNLHREPANSKNVSHSSVKRKSFHCSSRIPKVSVQNDTVCERKSIWRDGFKNWMLLPQVPDLLSTIKSLNLAPISILSSMSNADVKQHQSSISSTAVAVVTESFKPSKMETFSVQHVLKSNLRESKSVPNLAMMGSTSIVKQWDTKIYRGRTMSLTDRIQKGTLKLGESDSDNTTSVDTTRKNSTPLLTPSKARYSLDLFPSMEAETEASLTFLAAASSSLEELEYRKPIATSSKQNIISTESLQQMLSEMTLDSSSQTISQVAEMIESKSIKQCWYTIISQNHTEAGPLSIFDMIQALKSGSMQMYSLVWCEGMKLWQPLKHLPNLLLQLKLSLEIQHQEPIPNSHSIPPSDGNPGEEETTLAQKYMPFSISPDFTRQLHSEKATWNELKQTNLEHVDAVPLVHDDRNETKVKPEKETRYSALNSVGHTKSEENNDSKTLEKYPSNEESVLDNFKAISRTSVCLSQVQLKKGWRTVQDLSLKQEYFFNLKSGEITYSDPVIQNNQC